MADTASLIARVKTEGAEQSAKQLDNFSSAAGRADTSATKMSSSVEKATPKLRGFGTGAQQIGYQVQDMIVQIQGGTSAFVAIGQQGSQLAGAFGPGGAVIGAIIALSAAVGGTLVKSLSGARISAEDLEKSAKTLDSVLQKNKDGTYELSDSFVELTNSIDGASQAQAQFYQAQSAAVTQTEGAKDAVKELVDGLDSWTNGSAIGAQRALELGQNSASLAGYISDLADEFGITTDEAQNLVPLLAAVQKNASPENIQALGNATGQLVEKYGAVNPELVNFNGEVFKSIGNLQQAASQADTLAQQQDKLREATNAATKRIKEQNDQIIRNLQIGNMADKDRYAAQAQADKEAFAKREGVTKEQIAAYNAARDEEARQDIQRVVDTENKRAEAEQKAAASRASSEAQRAASREAQQKQQAQNFLDTLARQNSDEMKAIEANEQQKLAKLEEFRSQQAISDAQYEQAKTAITLEADNERAELLKEQQDKRNKEQNSADVLLQQIMAANEGELAEMDRQNEVKLQKLQGYYDQGLIMEEQFQAAKNAIAQQGMLQSVQYTANQFEQVATNMASAMQEGSKEAKAAAIAAATVAAISSAVQAYQSAAAIPFVGWIMGPIAAAAALAAGMANVQKIRSTPAREQGGNLNANAMAMVGERNKAEFIMPAGQSRVRTAEQMRDIMGQNGSSQATDNVTIVNNTSAQIGRATTERDDEGRLRIIIEEHVAASLQDSNSQISKSRRSTRGAPGFA